MARTTGLHPDGECKHRPPHWEKPGEGTRADDKDPPPPTTAGKARARHQGNTAPSDAEKRQKEEGTQRGRQGDTPPTDPSQGGRGTTQPRRERGHDTQHPHQTELPNQAQKGEDRHPNAPPTHRTTRPPHAHNTHPQNRPQHEPNKRTPHTKAQAPPAPQTQHTQTQKTRTQQPPPPGELQGRQKHR